MTAAWKWGFGGAPTPAPSSGCFAIVSHHDCKSICFQAYPGSEARTMKTGYVKMPQGSP